MTRNPPSFSLGSPPQARLVQTSGQGVRGWPEAERVRLLEAIFWQANDAVAVIDPKGVYLEQNETHRRLLGFTDEDLRGQTPAIHLGSAAFQTITAALQATGRFRGDVTSRTKDGREIPVELSAFSVRDEEGRVIAHVDVKRDLSGQRVQTKAVERSEAELREFLDHAPQGIHRAGPDGTILWANQDELDLLGYAADEFVGKSIADFHTDKSVIESILSRLRAGERVRGAEARLRCKDGAIREVVIDSDVHWEEGRFVHSRSFTRDVTDRKRAERDLRRLNEELERRVQQRTRDLENVIRERESFSYSVSHDLRTPLRTIRGFTTILLEDYGDAVDAKGRQYLEFVHGATTRMAEIIDDLLVLSRITSSDMQRRTVDLSSLAHQAVDRLRADAADREVDVDIEPNLVVEADAHLLGVLVENLVENAWKFTAKTPGARIVIGREPAGDRRFFVRDNGAGFDMAYVDRLFKPFQRLHSAREFEGTGIGLATVARIVERHGGRVAADGKTNQGAVFYFKL